MIDYFITDVSLFTFTYAHDSRFPPTLQWEKLARQDKYFSDFRIEIPQSVIEMAIEAPYALESLMRGIKPTLQPHGFSQARENLISLQTSIPTFKSSSKDFLDIDYDTWRYLVKYSYGIPFSRVHPLQVRYLQEIFEAIIVGKRMSPPVKRKLFSFTPRPAKGCFNIFRYGIYPLQNAVANVPIIRALDLVFGSVLFYGHDLGLRAIGRATAVRHKMSHLQKTMPQQLKNALLSYSQRKKKITSEILRHDIDKLILAVPGVLVGLSAIVVVVTEPTEWSASGLKAWAEALSSVTTMGVMVVDGKYLAEKWGWPRK